MANKNTLKFTDVVPERFRGPEHQEFSLWLKKAELGFRVMRMDAATKCDILQAYMDSPAQDLAMTFVSAYQQENDEPNTARDRTEYFEEMYKKLIEHLQGQSGVVGTQPELRLLDRWNLLKQGPAEKVAAYYHRMLKLKDQLKNQKKPFAMDELSVWTTFVNGLRIDVQLHVRTNRQPGPVELAVEAAGAYEGARAYTQLAQSSTPDTAAQLPRNRGWRRNTDMRGTVLETLRDPPPATRAISTPPQSGAASAGT